MRRLLPLVLTRAALVAANAPGPCRVLLVRHGETNFNAAGRIQGTLESELTSKGQSQAVKLGEFIHEAEAKDVDRVYVSPKKRTRQTLAGIESAQTLALPAAEVRPGLREIELTVWEGKLKSDLLENDPRWEVWNAKPASFVFAEDGHAPLGDLKRRAAEEWAALVAATPAGSTSLVVAHGAFNRVLLLTALGLPVDDFGFKDGHFAFENCALVELRWEPGDTHAAAWRKRYPTESEWRSREVEATRRAEVEGGEPPDVEAAEHGARVQGQQHQKGKEEL